MKSSWAAILFSFVLLAAAQAQQGADEKYLSIYSLVQQAETLAGHGESQAALTTWLDAQTQLQRFQKLYPDWNPGVISFRLDDVAKKIAVWNKATNALPSLAETNASPANTTAQIHAQLENLNNQVRAAQVENEMLQAKLKEALSAQPTTIDASELARAQSEILSLMKENDLLKAGQTSTRGSSVTTDNGASAQTRRELDSYAKQYAEQRARAEQLAADNEKLRQGQKATGMDTEALAALRQQNEKLKALVGGNTSELAQTRQQLADYTKKFSTEHARAEQLSAENTKLQKAGGQNQQLNTQLATPAPTASSSQEVDKLSAQIHAARTEIAALKSAAAVSTLEKTALEN